MATILPFAIRPVSKTKPRALTETAVVVIFPGVRREPGMAGTEPVQSAGTPGRRKKST